MTAGLCTAMLLQKSCSHLPALASHACSRSEGMYFVVACDELPDLPAIATQHQEVGKKCTCGVASCCCLESKCAYVLTARSHEHGKMSTCMHRPGCVLMPATEMDAVCAPCTFVIRIITKELQSTLVYAGARGGCLSLPTMPTLPRDSTRQLVSLTMAAGSKKHVATHAA
jgi:hypothetical protein